MNKAAIDLLCAMRPDVRREVFEDFIAGRSPQTPYLHITADEFTEIAEALTREVERWRAADKALREIANDSGFGARARMRAIARKALVSGASAP